MNQFTDNLNPEQREAVLSTDGPVLIFAGAGSGKTRVLVNRIAHIIESRLASPWQVMAVTFTNKGAREMQGRVGQLIPRDYLSVWISTFHSSGVKILRRHIERLGYDKSFGIYDESNRLTLIKDAMEVLNINPKIFNPKNVSARLSNAKNQLIQASDYPQADFFDEKVAKIYQLYEQALRKNNAIDYDDMLMLPVRLFKEFPDVLAQYQQQFRYFMVDEYQDTNHAQYVLINLLAQASQNLCVVGDDDQSIYGWRGADIRNILDFKRDYPLVNTIKLEQNYRSTKNILSAANGVIKKISDRTDKKLWTENPDGELITLYTAERDLDESRFVVEQIETLHREKNVAYHECALFYRTNAQSRVFEDELRRKNIPYVIYGGVRFYDRMEVKDLIAYLSVIVNPADSISLKRVVNVPARGIGKTTLQKIDDYALTHGLTFVDAMANALAAGVNRGTAQQLTQFLTMMEGFRTQVLAGENKLAELLQSVLDKTGYIDELEKEASLEANSRIENLEEFVNVVAEYEVANPNGSLAEFLDQISLVSEPLDASGKQKSQDTSDMLPLMTLHLAKGLEFPYVFFAGLEEGICPHVRSVDNPAQMDEERRLVYVGITRAEKKLYLSHCNERRFFGQQQFNLPSRFLEDLPKELIEHQKPIRPAFAISRDHHDFAVQPVAKPMRTELGKELMAKVEAKNASPYKYGVKVTHPIFGPGVIEGAEGEEKSRKVFVRFQKVGLKKLIAEFANLMIVS